MSTQGQPGYSTQQILHTTPLVGYRNWKIEVDHTNRLIPLTFARAPWTSGVNHAECYRSYTLNKCGLRGRWVGMDGVVHDDDNHTHEETCHVRGACNPAPQRLCGCGFWVTTDPGEIATGGWTATLGARNYQPISGVVEGGGRFVVGPKGFRCSQARVLALALPAAPDDVAVQWWVRRHEPSRKFNTDPAEMITGEDVEAFQHELVTGLSAAYPGVRFFGSRAEMVAAFEITDTRQLLESEAA